MKDDESQPLIEEQQTKLILFQSKEKFIRLKKKKKKNGLE